MAEKTKYQQLSEDVGRAEEITADREPTAGEVQQVDHLVARLRASASGGKRYRNLYERATAVQARIGDLRDIQQPAGKADPDDTGEPPAAKKKGRGFGRIYSELDRIAAITRPLKPEELQRLDDVVEETRTIAATDNSKMYRRLHQRAKLIQKSKVPPPKPLPRQMEGLRAVLPAGLVGSPRLEQARRQVLGGLPSSRRGH
ncbi:hypothetical protein OG921_16105 [Aldersonia sp. NBC_00410]|uniref:hypothetical protein n=1 Tax=Aldersonia sp. NBC_00410 TaxID=2975954 RepID=UPI0022576F7E|nr:hypothetical protein [Aldersonia sp. NBC_00410]MCX5044690.1 hypothetical protein [Aldersonia sp. NBC_00410]